MMWLELLAVLFFAVGMAGYPCCCRVNCGCCTVTPQSYIVTFTGIADQDCDDCTSLNGVAFEISAIGCGAELDNVELACDHGGVDPYPQISLSIDCSGGLPNRFYTLRFWFAGPVDIDYGIGATVEGDHPEDCTEIDLDVSMGNVDTAGGRPCDFSGASVNIVPA